MTAEQIFSIANLMAVLCWILLAALPDRRWVTDGVTGKAVPAVFAAAYIAIVLIVFPRAHGSFSTLAGVAALFANPWLLLGGWLHYLAFDLLIGTWEARDSIEWGVPRWVLIPCLFLTLMFGPMGWIAYKVAAQWGSRARSLP
jgi:Domain of unknown function (DUF4281)